MWPYPGQTPVPAAAPTSNKVFPSSFPRRPPPVGAVWGRSHLEACCVAPDTPHSGRGGHVAGALTPKVFRVTPTDPYSRGAGPFDVFMRYRRFILRMVEAERV